MGCEISCLLTSATTKVFIWLFVSEAVFSYFIFLLSVTQSIVITDQGEIINDVWHKEHVLISPLTVFFFSDQNKVQTDVVPPAFHRRNSFTPLSSQDQIKRRRLYSMGNPPQAYMSQAPTLPSMPFSEASEGAELQQSQVRVVNITLYKIGGFFF